MMNKRAVGRVVAAGLMALAGLVTTGPTPATASPAADTCVPGEACIVTWNGVVVYSNAGGAYPYISLPNGGYVWNNGVRYPGLDHIQLYTYDPDPGVTWTICLHYGRQPVFVWPNQTAGGVEPGDFVIGWFWRGECQGDDHWRRAS